ncbi:MAG: PDZ domain-containing protein [Elusimicrobiota bacterium]
MRRALIFTLLTVLLGASAEAQKTKRAPVRKTAPAEDAAESKTPAAQLDLPVLAGAPGRPEKSGLLINHILPRSSADDLGLRSGDVLLFLNGKPAKTLESAASALASWPPGTRLSAVVRRGGSVIRLETKPFAPSLPPVRDPARLTPHEEKLKQRHLLDAKTDKPVRIGAPGFTVTAGEKIWIRFPQGIPANIERGAVLEGVTSTSMSTDRNLDFIGIPQDSRVWAQVVSVIEDEEDLIRLVKLHIYKLELLGGHTYSCSAVPSKVSGERSLLRVSDGGTILSAALDSASWIVAPDRNIQIRFLSAMTIREQPGFYQAGPGLWFKSASADARKWLKVTHVISDRSADRAGIKKGDKILRLNGKPASRLRFTDAIKSLYGEVGSKISMDVQRGGGRTEKLSLTRGMLYRKGLGMSARISGSEVVVTAVHAESPADHARIKKGDRLVQVGPKPLGGVDIGELKRLLKQDLAGDSALIVHPPGHAMRTIELKQDWFPVPLEFTPRTGANEIRAEVPPASTRPRRGARRQPRGRSAPVPQKKP